MGIDGTGGERKRRLPAIADLDCASAGLHCVERGGVSWVGEGGGWRWGFVVGGEAVVCGG